MIGAGVVGALIGGAIALMLAPKVGAELREELKQTATRAGERIAEAGHAVAEKVRQTVGDLSQWAEAPEAEGEAPPSEEG